VKRRPLRRALALAGALSVAGLALAVAAQAFIPKAERVIRAVAERNEKAGRAQALRLDLVLRIEDSDAIGNGILITHPNGLARLELRGTGDLVERHVLQGGEHLATRNGERLAEPRAFLPPLFLLQAEDEIALRSGLAQLGADLDAIGLAPCGESDCYVIGDPARVPPPFVPRHRETGSDGQEAVDPITGAPYEPVPPPERSDSLTLDVARATVWVDIVTYEPKRIDLSDGVRVWLGPPATFGRVQVPSWIRIDEPGRRPATFDVVTVSPVDAPAAAFSRSWLERPVGLEAPPAETAPGTLSGENP
jgi:hypothetical protein